MFYMHLLINKRGPLAKIWLAAHWEKKLTKAHIFECNLETTIEKIISPKFTIALRTSGHLLLGVVRIYHRKAKYLLADCSEALTKMKTAFRPGLVDLPAGNFEAAYQSITLPEEFHDFETPLPDLNAIDVAEHFTLNQSRAEDISLAEAYESNILLCDRNFGERNEDPDALRKKSFFDGSILTSSNSLVADHNSASINEDKSVLQENTYCLEDDCFGDEEDAADMIEILLRDEQNSFHKDILDVEEEHPLPQDLPENSMASESAAATPPCSPKPPVLAEPPVTNLSHLTREAVHLLGEEGFVLEPVDDTAVTQRKESKRKRKLLVDVVKELSCHTIYNQLNNCTDILTTLDLAPPTKKTMLWKKSGGVDTLLSQPAQPVFHTKLQMLFARCFKGQGFKVGRNEIQRESEIEETRKEEDTTEMLMVEEPSYLQESTYSEVERKSRNNSWILMSQMNRNEPDDNCSDTRVSSFHPFRHLSVFIVPLCARVLVKTSLSESSSLRNHSQGQAAEPQPEESRNVCVLRAGSSLLLQKRTLLFLRHRQEKSDGITTMQNGKDKEETQWSKRTLQLLKTLQHLRRSGTCSFSFGELCRKHSRKEAAAKFYLFLVLKKQLVLKLSQSSPFADIIATTGPMFDRH
ncbi:RD21L protein, partial [Galbula dea]|nr:RD21L protein [Galbula dea]